MLFEEENEVIAYCLLLDNGGSEMDEKKPKLPAYMIFDNVDEYNKYEEGVHCEKNGLRGEKGKFVKPVNHILMTEEDIISEAEKIESRRKRERRVELEHKEELYSAKGYGLKEYFFFETKSVLVMRAKELLENPKKRAIFLARVNNVWLNYVIPAKNKVIEKSKFIKDVAHAVLTNEEPKALKLLDESENAEMIERSSDISSEKIFVEMTSEQRNKLIFAIELMADALKNVKVSTEQGDIYQLTHEERKQLLVESAKEQVCLLLSSDYKMNEVTEKFILECITREVEQISFNTKE